MLVLILAAIVGFGTFFVIYSLKGGFTFNANNDNRRVATKPDDNRSEESPALFLPPEIKEGKYKVIFEDGHSSQLTGELGDYIEVEFDPVESTSSIVEIPLPKTPIKPNPIDFAGFKISGNRLETDMFTLTVPDGWEACNAGDCIFMYDNRHQSERLYLFTLRSIKLTGEDFGAFLDKVFGNHAGLKSYTINENEYVYSDVSKGKKTIQVLLKPLGSSFGLMMQCHSQTNRLTGWQKEIVESLKLKPIKETINATK